MGRKFGFSFSASRALGISAAKGRISRSIGIPLTKSGRQRKAGRLLGGMIWPALLGGGGRAAAAEQRYEVRYVHRRGIVYRFFRIVGIFVLLAFLGFVSLVAYIAFTSK